MYRTFVRTSEEVFNRHPHGPTIRGLVGVMMFLNFLSFLSASLRSLSASPCLFLYLYLPPSDSNPVSLFSLYPYPRVSLFLSLFPFSRVLYLSSSLFHSLSLSPYPSSAMYTYTEEE